MREKYRQTLGEQSGVSILEMSTKVPSITKIVISFYELHSVALGQG